MLTRRRRVVLLALLTALSMINVIDRVDAQTGSLRVSTDLELIGIGGLGGGGIRRTFCGRRSCGCSMNIP
jgi:hypothetical protein